MRAQPNKPRIALALTVALAALTGATITGRAAADSFDAAMDASMMRMHAAMSRPGTGNPDHDFAAAMIPHHQGAIEMAEAELRFGHDEVLRRLAQGVIVEQQQEIMVMQHALASMGDHGAPATSHKEQ